MLHIVTGGAGFIGKNLIKELAKSDCSIVVVDNFSSSSEQDFYGFLEQHGIECESLNLDITSEVPAQRLVDLISTKDVQVWHLACPASPVWYSKDPITTTMTSVLGTYNICHLVSRCNPKIPILFTSTSEVYGDPQQHPQTESYKGNVSLDGPRACYDEGKRVAETLCYDFRKKYGLNTKVVRLFNTYGPNMAIDDGRVVSNFINQVISGKPITIFGDGSQTRSLCYVQDTIEALLLVMQQGINGPINIGNPEEITIFELACCVNTVAQHRGYSKSNIEIHASLQDDPKQRCPSIVKMNQLGWNPKVLLLDGLNDTFTFFENLRSEHEYDIRCSA